MRVAIYARVSSDRQENENQLRELREFCGRQGWEIADEFIDQVSAKNDKRSRFQAMFAAAEKRRFDLVLFWALDRFSREGVLATLKHLERLTAAGVGWKSYSEQYLDSLGVFRDAVLAILAVVAKQERIRISERTLAGLETARRKGKVLGRPRVVFRRDEAERLRAEGLSWRQVSERMGVKVTTLRDALAKGAE